MSKLKSFKIGENGMLFDPTTGESFEINETAQFILPLLQKGETAPQVAKKLAKAFGVTYDVAIADVEEFQSQLESMGLAA